MVGMQGKEHIHDALEHRALSVGTIIIGKNQPQEICREALGRIRLKVGESGVTPEGVG